MKRYILEIAAFLAGFSIMALELTTTRIMAPFLGNSIIVWTSIIGTVLAFLSLGYYWGGKISDKNPSKRTFASLFLASSAFIGAIPIEKNALSPISLNFGLFLASIISSALILGPANFFLGAIFPYASRLAIKNVKKSGSIVGKISALSSFGSIAGVFLAGFFLIPHIGSTNILYILSLALFLVSLVIFFSGKTILFGIVSLSLIFFSSKYKITDPNKVFEKDTLYNHIIVLKETDPKTKRQVLKLTTGRTEVQSSMFLDDPYDYPEEYKKFFRNALLINPGAKKILMIGGGAYTSPKDYLKMFPQTEITVVEIDPELTLLAKQYFSLPEDSRLKIYHQDARIFLNESKPESFDVILMDAFAASIAPPFQLTTKEAVEKIYKSLTENGIVMMNIVSTLEGPGSDFLRAEFETYKNIFPEVKLFPVQNPEDIKSIQNIILVALKKNSEEISRFTDNKGLTDDYAPVEFQLLPLYKYINL